MNDRFSRRVLEHVRHDRYTPAEISQLMTDLGVEETSLEEFQSSLSGLASVGKIEIDSKGLVRLPKVGDEIIGVFRKNPKGFGFIVPATAVREGDVFVGPENCGVALSGDTVRALVRRGRKPSGEEGLDGKIIEIIARKRKVFTGELVKQGAMYLVNPDGREMTDPIVIRDPHAKNANVGNKVVIEITHYPEKDLLAEGVIVDVLGVAGQPSVETQATIAAFALPGEFPDKVVEQARATTEQFDREVALFETDPARARKTREDLRAEFIITIDPPDAKDYDDAIHIKRLPGGGWELGVHIADVAHFIAPGSALDEEAKIRGNSVYLPRLVIPMLPETLSNGICSLQEAVPRFCKSATMHYDAGGRVTASGFASTLIKSVKRLTYLEAQALIDGDQEEAKKHAKTEPVYTPQLIQTLQEMNTCAKAIRQRRRADGMIHLDLPEVDLVFDENGRVIDAVKEDDAFTHTLIEMFMVEANEALARLFERLKVPLLRRIHPEPVPGDVDELRTASKVAGFTIPSRPTRQELQKILDGTKGTPAGPAVHFAVLRTLSKAEYSPALIGHYALASEAYAHFTSPIRRYPDLTVHRALAEFLKRTSNGENPPRDDKEFVSLGRDMHNTPNCPDEEALAAIGRNCSVTEKNASDAESHLRSFLVLQLLSEHVGETFRGMVTGVKAIGVFIQLEKYLAEGLIKKEDLPTFANRDGRMAGGGWRFDARSGIMMHEGSGRTFAIGDQVMVTIAKVDLALRKMDLVVTDAASRERSEKAGKGAQRQVEKVAGGLGGGGLNIDYEQLKSGKSGAERRSQKSKSRDKGKTQHRRDSK